MPKIKLYHGSDHIIEKPNLLVGKPNNDYGRGFYCTRLPEMASEWACKNNTDGVLNEYDLNTDTLHILNLASEQYSILNWLAVLLEHRTFSLKQKIAEDAKAYILKNFSVDLRRYDVVIGYRADDSYFAYAEDFVNNTLPLSGLNEALYLGKLGLQTVLISEKAFDNLKFIKSSSVNKDEYYDKFSQRDSKARQAYRKMQKSQSYENEIFAMDILREGLTNENARIQRIILG